MALDKRKGNLHAARNNPEKQRESVRRSTKGYYVLDFTDSYTGVSERDVELRRDYAKGLVANYYNLDQRTLHLRKKSEKQTAISLDEVYYVKAGDKPIGKISIRVTRLFKDIAISFVFQRKRNGPNGLPRNWKYSH